MNSMNDILLVVAHAKPQNSRFSATWAQEAKKAGYSVHILAENLGPDASFDLEKEKQLLLSHNTIVLSFPIWWYNMPWLLSKWFTDVLTADFAYGKAHFLKGKTLSCLISCGGPETAYTHEGLAHTTIPEFLPSIGATASYCGMEYIDPFIFYGANSASAEQVAQSVASALAHLKKLSL